MKCKNCKNFEPSYSGKIQTGHNEGNTGTLPPSFRTITILAGPQGSGKTVQAEKMAEGKKTFVKQNDGDLLICNQWILNIDVLIFEEITSIKQIRQIINAKLQIKEIIICTTL